MPLIIPRAGAYDMILDVYFEDRVHQVEVTTDTLESGSNFFAKMDQDMDMGWKVGPEFIEQPDRVVRGQIVAGKLLKAIEQRNANMVRAMAGYIASRIPEARSIYIDTGGEPLNTEFRTDAGESIG
jgi:hypothetical protein